MILLDYFKQELFVMLRETFEEVHGQYLDRGTSLFETLAGISAEEASRPVSAKCASIAGQVEHTRFYLHVLCDAIEGTLEGKADWAYSWRVTTVSPAEWDSLREELRAGYQRVLAVLHGIESWDAEDPVSGALSILTHTAYHLGEIRQALCTVRTSQSAE